MCGELFFTTVSIIEEFCLYTTGFKAKSEPYFGLFKHLQVK